MRTRLAALAVAVGPLWWLGPTGEPALPTALPAAGFDPKDRRDKLEMPSGEAGPLRRDALARAKLWRQPVILDLRENPPGPGGFSADAAVVCKFHPDQSSGATPKFECVFEGGEVLKVKYGNPEVHTEVA